VTNYRLLGQCGVFVRELALDPEECARILKQLGRSPGAPAEVSAASAASEVDERTRRARSVEPPEAVTSPVEALLGGLRPALEEHFTMTLAAHEPPHYLLYRSGDFFAPHRDRARATAASTSDRRISGVLFLNDDFSGGDLRLYGLLDGKPWDTIGVPCPAAPGLFVAFPSGTLHEVAPVTAGVRGTIVTWFF
jgi:predicted 2-oxoglutarate/Fe(II)-dependent dioxygenase YbiX